MRVLLTGGSGMVGRCLLDTQPSGYEVIAPSRRELDLMDPAAIGAYLRSQRIEAIVHAAARVGGIQANIADPAGFLYENAMVNLNVIHAAAAAGIRFLVNLGSSCMYPRDYQNPLCEEYLLAAPLEPTNEGYALAKILGARLCEYFNRQGGTAFKTLIPSNLYGRYDHFDPSRSHLVPAVLLKLHEAKSSGAGEVTIWGDGKARREFLFAHDLCEFIWRTLPGLGEIPDYLNLGYGHDFTVMEYYEFGRQVVGFEGEFRLDLTKPVGMTRKLLDSSRAHRFGWQPQTHPLEGMAQTYQYYLSRQEQRA